MADHGAILAARRVPEPSRSLLVESLHVVALAGFAIAQPIYDLLARHSGFFVVRRCEPADLLILAGALSLLLPAAFAGLLAVARRMHRGAGVLCHRVAVAALSAALALQAVKGLAGLSGWAAVALAAAAGTAAAAAYHRLATARLFLSLLTPAILVFPVLFLLHPSVFKILRPEHAQAIAAAGVRSEAPVVLIVFDALPETSLMNMAGGINADRFPSFARLAAGATWYRGATTVSADTIWAVPAILTGNYPDLDLQPSFYDHPRNLFTLFGSSYQPAIFEHLTDLCPAWLCPRTVPPLGERLRGLASDLRVVFLHLLLPEDLTSSLPGISHAWGDFAMGEDTPGKRNRSKKYQLFLRAIDPGKPRTLYFLHSLFPHDPYLYLPSGKSYARDEQGVGRQILLRGRWSDDEWAVLENMRRHLLQVGLVDRLLGGILERLRETGLYDRSLIAVTADHGVSFRPGDYRRKVSGTNFADVMPVPLFIKRPGQTVGEIDDRNVETIDILPTIADLLGVELPWPTDGVSAASPAGASRPERPTKVCYGCSGSPGAGADADVELPVAAFDARQEVVERIARTFGGGDFAAVLGAGPHPELIGREVGRLDVEASAGGLSARLADPSLFRQVDPGTGFVPALVEGFVELEGDRGEPLRLAVAVNGVIGATTRTYLEPVGRGLLAWSAMVPETALRAGANDVEVLVIEDAGQGVRLRRTAPASRALFSGVRLGTEPVRGVGEAGFHEPETVAGATIRWTSGAAKLIVPIGPQAPPATLRVDLALTGPRDNELAVAVNGRELFRGALAPGPWSRTFDLSNVPLGGQAVIELASGTFVPKQALGTADARTLGVAVAGIWLDGQPED